MLNMKTASRAPGRSAGRWFGVVSIAAVLALSIAGCTADPSTLGKSLEAGQADAEIDTQAFYETVDEGYVDDDGSDDPLIVEKGEDPAAAEDPVEDPAADEGSETGEAPAPAPQGLDPTDHSKNNGKYDPVKINMEIATPVALQRDYYTVSAGSVGCDNLPDRPAYTIEANGLSHFCSDGSKAVDAKIEAWYKIPGGKDVLWFKVNVPYWGHNMLDCEVRKAGTTERSVDSKYTCEKAWLTDGGTGNNPHPKVKLVPKKQIVVTNVAQARTLLKENCADGQPRCTYDAAKTWVALDDWSEREILSGPAFNCNNPHDPDHHEWSKGETYEWTNKIGVEAGIKWAIIPKELELEVTGHYEHVWTEAYDFKQKLVASVQYETAHYFFTQQGKIHVLGDFYIGLKDYVYVIKDTEFEFPLAKKYKLDKGGGRVIEPVAWSSSSYPIKCKNGRPVSLPDPFVDEPLETTKSS